MATMQKMLSEIRELHADEWNVVAGGDGEPDPEPGPVGPPNEKTKPPPSYADTSCHNGVCFQDRID